MTDYLDGFQYVNHALNFFPHAEGFVDVKGTNAEGYKYFYVYNYTDHLGNIRVSYGFDPDTRTVKTLEENHYYPFGLKHTNYNTYKRQFKKEDPPADAPPTSISGLVVFSIKQVVSGEMLVYKYKYNGMEWQDELGLNVTAMGFRQYDPAIGRFNGMDRLCEIAFSITPYRFAYNNPVYWNDPTGLLESGNELSDYYELDDVVYFDPNVGPSTNLPAGAKYIGTTYLNEDTGTHWNENGEPTQMDGGELEGVTVSGTKSSSTSSFFSLKEGYGLFGTNRYGDLGGHRNGTRKHSIDTGEIPGNGAGGRSVRGSTKNLGWLERLFSFLKGGNDVGQRVSTIQTITEKGNTSTMEVQNTEPVAPPPQAAETAVMHIVQQDTASYDVVGLSKSDPTHKGFNSGPAPKGLNNAKKAGNELLKMEGIDSVSIKKKY
jgi:RHS repeat-associated protein